MVEKSLSGAASSFKPRIGEGISGTPRGIQQTIDTPDPLIEKRRLFEAETPDFYAPALRGTLIPIPALVEYIPKSRRGY